MKCSDTVGFVVGTGLASASVAPIFLVGTMGCAGPIVTTNQCAFVFGVMFTTAALLSTVVGCLAKKVTEYAFENIEQK